MQSALISLRQDHGYSSLLGFVDAFFGSSDQQVSAQASRFAKSHTATLVDHLQAQNPGGVVEVAVDVVNYVLAREGNTLTTLLAWHELGSVMRVLEMFSMDDLKTQLQEHAPVLLGLLRNVVLTQMKRDRMMGGIDPRRDHEMVLTMSCMSGCLLIMGTGAGNSAKKGLIEMLAHAGLSLSYNSIVNKMKILSAKGLKLLQRVESMDHFDNGTTGTLIPLFNPRTGGTVPHGMLPHSLKEPRVGVHTMMKVPVQVLLPTGTQEQELCDCCLWQLKRLAVENIQGFAQF
ncbi:hypothetical protein K439DRAFT_1619402 [Ramaria rubella]|nr:hypothetical protein K439DRAFT_1619402 [Ramaria rubella]